MLSERIAVTYPMVAIGPFVDDNVSASQTDVQLTIVGALANEDVVMPRPGWVVGMSINLSAAATAGSLTVGVTINGSENTDTTQTITTATKAYPRWTPRDVAPRFAAGDNIGVEITTNGTWNGTTSDLIVYVYVVFENWEM